MATKKKACPKKKTVSKKSGERRLAAQTAPMKAVAKNPN